MATSDEPPKGVTTEEEFDAALSGLVRSANANDVDIEGGWEYRTADGEPDWDVVILEVRERDDDVKGD